MALPIILIKNNLDEIKPEGLVYKGFIMDYKRICEDVMFEISDLLKAKEFEIDSLKRKLSELQKEVQILNFKKLVYSSYTKRKENKNGSN